MLMVFSTAAAATLHQFVHQSLYCHLGMLGDKAHTIPPAIRRHNPIFTFLEILILQNTATGMIANTTSLTAAQAVVHSQRDRSGVENVAIHTALKVSHVIGTDYMIAGSRER